MMVTCSRLSGLLGLLLLASVAALRPSLYGLRDLPPSSCGFAHYGSAVGSAQRLVETHLGPGVADWNIVVPMPPPCENAPVTGVDMRVCDDDAPPDVSMSDVRSARVHRAGQLAGFAAVNVTVYCILPPDYALPPPTTLPPPMTIPPPTDPPPTTPPTTPPPRTTPPPHTTPPPPTAPLPRTIRLPPTSPPLPSEPLVHLTDTSTAYEMLSNELNLKEVASNEETSDESESVEMASTELKTRVKSTLTTTLTPMQETSERVELAQQTEVVTHPPNKPTYPQERPPQSMQLTINITPSDRVPTEGGTQSYDVDLPLLSNKENPNEVMSSFSPKFSSAPYIETPSRMFGLPPHKHVKRPRQPGSALQPLPAPAYPPRYPSHYAPHYPHYAPPYGPQPNPLAPLYRPLNLLGPRLRYLQRRQPLMFFRHF